MALTGVISMLNSFEEVDGVRLKKVRVLYEGIPIARTEEEKARKKHQRKIKMRRRKKRGY